MFNFIYLFSFWPLENEDGGESMYFKNNVEDKEIRRSKMMGLMELWMMVRARFIEDKGDEENLRMKMIALMRRWKDKDQFE